MELFKNVANAPNWVTGDNKLSRAGAFLWVFTVMHALPNFLLLSDPATGLKEYQGYADNARAMMVLPVFEIYLAVSLIVHAFLAAKTVYTKGTSSIGWLATTGAVMLFFLITHLLDFRFAGENVLQDLGHFMPSIVSDKKLWYAVGIVATTIHCVKAIRIAWFLSLGFKMKEIPYLMFIGRVMTFVSAVAYLVPVVKL